MRNTPNLADLQSSNQELLDENTDLRDKLGAMEDAAKVRQEQLQTLSAAIRIGYWEWDEATKKAVYFSKEMADIFGMGLDSLYEECQCEEDFFSFIHPDDLEHYIDNLSIILGPEHPRGLAHIFEYRIVRPDGEMRYVRELEYGVREEGSVITRSFGAIQDITEQVSMRKDIEESAAKLKLAARTAKLGYWHYDEVALKYLDVSEEYAGIHGYTVPEYLDRFLHLDDDMATVHPEDKEALYEAYELAKGKQDIVFRTQHKDGHWIHVREIATDITDEAGNCIESIGTMQDITELKEHEKDLEKRDTIIRQFELVPGIGHYIWNLDTEEYLYVSPGLTDIYGLPRTDFLQRVGSFEDDIALLHEDDRERMLQIYESRKTNQHADAEYRVRQPSGEIRWIREKSISIWDSASMSNQAIGVLKDITEQKEAEQTLRHSRDLLESQVLERTRQLSDTIKQLELEITERKRISAELENKNAELERFAYTVSHDLKTPLITINGFIGILEKEISANDKDRVTGHIEKISNAANTMGTLLNDLLELSRIGRVMDEPKTCDLSDIVRKALDQVVIRVQQQGVKITAGDMPEVFGDEKRLVEVFVNLVENAIKFMGDQIAPQIQIGSVDKAGMICCYVHDNGIGIPPEFHEKIFSLFERLDASPEGTGVGLALVKRIVEVHGGEVWVESDGTGRGSSFLFTLPKS
jgi:PAS domain S-box-containing protein